MTLIFLLSCANPTDPKVTPPTTSDDSATTLESPLIPLSPPRLLRRISLDLTGQLPSTQALDDVEANPEAWTTWRDVWLEDPRFESHLVTLLGERWHTRIDDFQVDHPDFGLVDSQEYAYERAVGEEPLRLIAYVAATDAPWSEVVTASYTIANPMLAEMWPLSCPQSDGWGPCTYTDGRPMSGVLSTNGLWWRYTTTPTNLNRGRVAAILRLLVCEDILARPVSFSDLPALVDVNAAADAIRNEPACQSCHNEIEPVSAALMGFYWTVVYSRIEHSVYHAEREFLAEGLLGVEPAWYGTPLSGLGDLGPAIAADPRFSSCAVESFSELLWRRPVQDNDTARLSQLGDGWDGRVKSLIRRITESPEYQAGDVEPSADATGEVLVRMVSPAQLADSVEQLSGFRWTWEGADQLDNDEIGYRLLAGGVDGDAAVRAQQDPGLTWSMVVKRLSEAAAANIVAVDLIGGQQQRLLRGVTLETLPDDPAFDQQIRDITWQLYAERIDDEELQLHRERWTELAAISDPATAWTALVSVLLRDTRMVSY